MVVVAALVDVGSDSDGGDEGGCGGCGGWWVLVVMILHVIESKNHNLKTILKFSKNLF